MCVERERGSRQEEEFFCHGPAEVKLPLSPKESSTPNNAVTGFGGFGGGERERRREPTKSQRVHTHTTTTTGAFFNPPANIPERSTIHIRMSPPQKRKVLVCTQCNSSLHTFAAVGSLVRGISSFTTSLSSGGFYSTEIFTAMIYESCGCGGTLPSGANSESACAEKFGRERERGEISVKNARRGRSSH